MTGLSQTNQTVSTFLGEGLYTFVKAGVPSFEGQNYLSAYGGILMTSPDGFPIQSFSLHLFTSPPPPLYTLEFGIAGQQATITQFNAWQQFQGSFSSPVQSVLIFATDSIAGGDRTGHRFNIDAIEFTTVPEPQTFWLLSIGLTAIAFHPLLKRPKPTRA